MRARTAPTAASAGRRTATGARTTLPAPSGTVWDFDLSPEGEIAPTTQVPPAAAWASAAEPVWHPLGVHGLDYLSGAHIGGGKIVLQARVKNRRTTSLLLLERSGARTVLAERPRGLEPVRSPIDFDGTTVTWSDTTCDTLTVFAQAITAEPHKFKAKSHCPVTLSPRARGGRIRIRCPSPSVPPGRSAADAARSGGRPIARPVTLVR